jgi:glucuronoarabinoxylan endo-1,4-beta-xylanase
MELGMTQNIKINYLETNQLIQGFGCFGGRETPFFADARRDDIMHALFEDLQLSIVRTEVKPSFSTKPGERNFNMAANLDIPPNDPYFNSPDQAEVERRSQLWILKTAKQRYPHIKIVPSVWSPPYYMLKKTIKKLSKDYYKEFASFLADYIEAYQKVDIPIFAMSPQNEPENIFSPWDVCLWLPPDTATFVKDHMKPVFQQRELDTKIMVGESANWGFNSIMLGLVNLFLGGKKQDVDILASHAYSLPNIINKTVNYDTSPLGLLPSGYKSTWITESCATTLFDPSMKMGLQAAICIHKFLAVSEVNAFIFWLGMIRGNSNEALVSSDGVGNYQLTKVYDVIGNYSKYVKEGYRRLTTNSSSLASSLYVSAFKGADTDNLSMVMINESDDLVPISIHVEQAPAAIQTLKPYMTPAELGVRWQAGEAVNLIDGKFNTNLLPSSVTTFTSSS